TEKSPFFSHPTLLQMTDRVIGDSTMATPPRNFRDSSVDSTDFTDVPSSFDHNFPYLGIFAGTVPYSRRFEKGVTTGWMANTHSNNSLYLDIRLVPQPHFSIVLECWDGSHWRPYSSIARFGKTIIGQHYMANKTPNPAAGFTK